MEEHGGNIWSRLEFNDILAGKFIKVRGRPAAEGRRLLDFSANINPLGLPRNVVTAIRENIPNLIHYPDPYASCLRGQIAEYSGLEPSQVLVGNGTTQLMYLIYRVLKPKQAIIPVPSFSEYEKAVSLSDNIPIYFHRLRSSRGFRIEADRLLNDIVKHDDVSLGRSMVVLGNPNNPTGDLVPIEVMIKLVKELHKRRIWLVVDEAFIDFVPDDDKQSLVRQTQQYQNLVVLRTLTKFFAMPGLRVGYAVGCRKVISKLNAQIEPWSVNHLAQAAASVILKDKDYIRRSKEYIIKEYNYLIAQLNKISFLEPYPSAVNFILCRIKHGGPVNNAYQLTKVLEEKGVLVRNCANFRNLSRAYIRVAVRTRAENRRFIRALKELL